MTKVTDSAGYDRVMTRKETPSELYSEKFLRNPLDRKQQAKVKKAVFAIVGLGGTGGFILENLLRMGAEHILVFDRDRFELSNFNRQMLATEEFLDMPKVHAAVARAKTINRDIDITSFGEFSEVSVSEIKDVDLLIDGTDNVASKLTVARAARKRKIPFVFCSASSSRGIVTIFTTYKFEKAFQLQVPEVSEITVPAAPGVPEIPGIHGITNKDDLKSDLKNGLRNNLSGNLSSSPTCASIICPAASLAGTLAASQAVNYLIGKPYAKAPSAIFFDLFKKDVFWRSKLG